MNDIWSGLATALIAAVVAFVTTRVSTSLDRRHAARNADADWSVKALPAFRDLPGRGYVLVNSGSREASHVGVVVEGGSYEFEPNARVDTVGPGAAVGIFVTKPGNGHITITWTSHTGASREARRFLFA